MSAKDEMEQKMPLILDIVVGARVSASPRHTALAPHLLPRYKARDGFAPCLCWSFPSPPRLQSPLWSSVPVVGDGALDVACQ
jgi:hypothetical protein